MARITLACQSCSKLNRIDVSKAALRPKCAACGRPFQLDRPVKITEQHFDTSVLDAEVPVLVDFYADWCAPCKALSPLLEEIAEQQVGKLLVAKVDTDRAPIISQRYGIRSIPFFGRFEGGALVKTAVGAVGREALADLAR